MLDKILKGNYPEALQVNLEDADPNNDPAKRLEDAANDLQARDLSAIPFGFRVRHAIVKDLRSTPARFRNFAGHNKDVFEHINILFANFDVLTERTKGIDKDLGEKDRLRERLLLAALLHDIGKALDVARHPTLGWHVLFDLALVGKSDRNARDELIKQLGEAGFANPAEEYRRLAWFVRDHDKFGVISTGEASYVILASLISVGRDAAERSIAQIRDTWLLNIADIAGTKDAKPTPNDIGKDKLADSLDVRADKLEALTSDWNRVYAVLKDRNYAKVIEGLRELSETPELTVQRVRRLLTERAGNWPGLREAFSDDVVQEAIETHLSPRDFLPFCRDFAMVAKLDYALQFWSELADYSYIRQILHDPTSPGATRIFEILAAEDDRPGQNRRPGGGPRLPEGWAAAYSDFGKGDQSRWIGLLVDFRRNHELRDVWQKIQKELTESMDRDMARARAERIARNQAGLLIAILRRIVTAYQGLIRGGIASERAAIGVGFSYLRSDDAEKRFALYELLSGGGDGRERGLRWLIDEIASWEMLA